MVVAERAALEQLESRLALLAISQWPRHHLRILADEIVEIALHGIDALDPEADMLEPERHRIVAGEIGHLPRRDQQRDPPVRQIVITVLRPVEELQLED